MDIHYRTLADTLKRKAVLCQQPKPGDAVMSNWDAKKVTCPDCLKFLKNREADMEQENETYHMLSATIGETLCGLAIDTSDRPQITIWNTRVSCERCHEEMQKIEHSEFATEAASTIKTSPVPSSAAPTGWCGQSQPHSPHEWGGNIFEPFGITQQCWGHS